MLNMMTRSIKAPAGYFDSSSVVGITNEKVVSLASFLGSSKKLTSALLPHRYVINVCQSRLSFITGFMAAMMKGQTTLMPSDMAPMTLAAVEDKYRDVYYLSDQAGLLEGKRGALVDISGAENYAPIKTPSFPSDFVAAITFTSGSSGAATCHPKSWGSLVAGAISSSRRFTGGRPVNVVATVPPQHMYGFETSVMLPLMTGSATYAGKPFFPKDIELALNKVPSPRMLVTTPVHLKFLVSEKTDLPPIEFVISATAPLSTELAGAAENLFDTKVYEIFGCTEAGSIASRRTVETDIWQTLDGVLMKEVKGEFFASGGHVPGEIKVSDQFELIDEKRFIHLGRISDMLNIAGKRTSLAYLNVKLGEIEGVEDGVFYSKEGVDTDGAITRLAAFVVAPALSEEEILKSLKQKIDPLFLPRPIRFVRNLGRNATGKLTRARLMELVTKQSHDK